MEIVAHIFFLSETGQGGAGYLGGVGGRGGDNGSWNTSHSSADTNHINKIDKSTIREIFIRNTNLLFRHKGFPNIR